MIDPNQCSRCGEQATEIRSGPANGSYRLANLSCDCGWRWQLILPPLPPHWRWLYANVQVTPSKRDASMAVHHLTMKEFSALTTERDRLREALEQIVNPVGMVGGNLQDIARAALDVQERT